MLWPARYTKETIKADQFVPMLHSQNQITMKVPLTDLAIPWMQEEAMVRGALGKAEVRRILERVVISGEFKTDTSCVAHACMPDGGEETERHDMTLHGKARHGMTRHGAT